MFAVDPPNRPADRKNGKHKGQSVSKENDTQYYCPNGMLFLTFWLLSRKIKQKLLSDLCDSSEAGGESTPDDLCIALYLRWIL